MRLREWSLVGLLWPSLRIFRPQVTRTAPVNFSLGRSLKAISSSRTDFLVWKIPVGIAMLNIKIDHHMRSF